MPWIYAATSWALASMISFTAAKYVVKLWARLYVDNWLQSRYT